VRHSITLEVAQSLVTLPRAACAVRWPLVRYEAQPTDDVYALGMTAYRLLTGEYPPALMDVVRTGKARRFAHLPLVLPERWKAESPELAALLHQMLSAEPAARDSAGEAVRSSAQPEAMSPAQIQKTMSRSSSLGPVPSQPSRSQRR